MRTESIQCKCFKVVHQRLLRAYQESRAELLTYAPRLPGKGMLGHRSAVGTVRKAADYPTAYIQMKFRNTLQSPKTARSALGHLSRPLACTLTSTQTDRCSPAPVDWSFGNCAHDAARLVPGRTTVERLGLTEPDLQTRGTVKDRLNSEGCLAASRYILFC